MGNLLQRMIGGDGLPLGMVSALALTALLWNLTAGLQWTPSLSLLLAVPCACLGLAGFYRLRKPSMALVQDLLTYMALWAIYSLYAVRLTYLGLLLGFPFRDGLYTAWDASLGFHWGEWARFIAAHPALDHFLAKAYESNGLQILLAVPILAVWAPGKNRELMTAIFLALIITLLIATLMPARGIAEQYGFKTNWGPIIDQLRQGGKGPFPYVGILFFPSFHTVTAVLLVIAMRTIKWAFWLYLLANIALVLAVPLSGGHYLVDVLAGIAVAAISQYWAVRLLAMAPKTLEPDASIVSQTF